MGGGPSNLNPTDRPSVLIVGGGYAGTAVARLLDPHFFVVLLDRKDHLIHYVALPRALVEPQRASAMHIPYHRLMTHGGIFIQAHVTSISPTAVTVSGLSAPITGFTYLIIATGSSYNLPARIGPPLLRDKLPLVQSANSAVKSSNSVLIIGAGPVGVEMAGEIATDHPDKQVTLVSAHDYLGVPGLPEKFTTTVQAKLEGLGVTVIRGAKVTIPDAVSATLSSQDELYLAGRRTWQLTNGQQVEADLTFFSVGSILNTSALTPLASVQSKRRRPPHQRMASTGGSHQRVRHRGRQCVGGEEVGVHCRGAGEVVGEESAEDSQAAGGYAGVEAVEGATSSGVCVGGEEWGCGDV